MGMKIDLPSGKVLDISTSPFADSRALYQAVLEEVKGLDIDPKTEMDVKFFKDLFCIGLSSKKIESALEKCFDRSTYDGKRITKDTFEPIEAREDYLDVCFHIAKENILPFTKSLSARYSHILEALKSGLK